MNQKTYAGFIGFVTGTGSWLAKVGITQAFIGDIIKTIVIAIVSTLTGLLVRSIYMRTFGKD